jgi:membrane protease YdiL (CAAX protease family)
MRTLLIDSEGRLRTAWRLLVFGALALVLQTAIVLGVGLFVDPRSLLQNPLGSSDPIALLSNGMGIIVATMTVYIARRWLDRRPFLTLGLSLRGPWLKQIIGGALLGIGLQAAIFVTELGLGWLAIDRVGWRGPGGPVLGLIVMAFVFLAVAWNEELITRGYMLQNLEVGVGTTLAVVISSVVFGFLHIFNDNSSVIASLGVAFAGLLLAAAYLTTRSLWLPIGLHLGWNFGEGPLFGFPVSGIDAGGLVSHRAIGPEAITGGAFGPEAGLVSVVAELVGIGLLWLWYRRQQNDASSAAPSTTSSSD